MTGTVTVIMPNLNHGRYARGALHALAGQSLPPERVLFFDDGSSDDSLDVVRSLQTEIPYLEMLANGERRGVVANCNAGLAMVATEYVYFAAADDRILEDFLATAVRLLDANPGIPLCVQGSVAMAPDGALSKRELTSLADLPEGILAPRQVFDRFQTHSVFMAGNAAVYRTNALRELGGFPEIGPYSDSVTMFVLALHFGVCTSPVPRAAWRRMEGGYSAAVKRNPERALALIAGAKDWLAVQLIQTPFRRFPDLWKARALYQLASPLIIGGYAEELHSLLPGGDFWAALMRLGPPGRRLANALLLLCLAPRAFMQMLRGKWATAL